MLRVCNMPVNASVGRALYRYRKGHGFKSCSSLNFCRLCFRNCLVVCITVTINHVFISLSTIKMSDLSYSIVFFTIYGYITNSQHDQLPVGLIAQLVEHRAIIAKVMGLNSVQV